LDLFSIFIIALGLSVDSFAISVTSGIILKNISISQTVKIGFFLSFFQAGMPVIGWLAGYSFKSMIVNYDHWLAFFLLFAIGLKMLIDGFKNKPIDNKINPLNMIVLIGLSVATSIDALIVGVSFGVLEAPILISAIIIGSITFIASVAGLKLGCRFSKLVKLKLDAIAGIVLIGIGTKILIEHLYF